MGECRMLFFLEGRNPDARDKVRISAAAALQECYYSVIKCERKPPLLRSDIGRLDAPLGGHPVRPLLSFPVGRT